MCVNEYDVGGHEIMIVIVVGPNARSLLAQLVERETVNLEASGSTPLRRVSFLPSLTHITYYNILNIPAYVSSSTEYWRRFYSKHLPLPQIRYFLVYYR